MDKVDFIMEYVDMAINIILTFAEYILGFFTGFIEAISRQISAGNIFVPVCLLIFLYIKLKKMKA